MWIAIVKVAGFGFLFTWFGYIAAFEHFDATRPITPDYAKGAVIPHNNHGHIVYLTKQEQLHALERIPIGLGLVAIVAAYFHKKATGKTPN